MKHIVISMKDCMINGDLNLCAEYHINHTEGRDPYILEKDQYRPAVMREYHKAIYLRPEQLKAANELLLKISALKTELNTIINQ